MKDILKKAVDYLKGILADSHGSPSSKRVISVVFALLIGIGYVANLFWGYHVDDNLLDAVMMIVIAGLGFTGVEKFAPRATPPQDPDPLA
jgi:hypothetical protein